MSELEIEPGEHVGSDAPRPSAPDFAVATQPSYARTLFLGPDGLRPGWGLAFYVSCSICCSSWLRIWRASRDLGASGLWSMMLEEFGNLVAAVDSGRGAGASRASPLERLRLAA